MTPTDTVATESNRATRSPAGSAPWLTLAALLLLLGLVGQGVSFMASERAARLADAQPVKAALRDYVIPPDREATVRELLAPIESGALPGLDRYAFSIQKSSIRVQLFGEGADEQTVCAGPPWVAAPGALVLSRAPPEQAQLASPGSGSARHESLWVSWHWCGDVNLEAREASVIALTKQLGARPELDRIWQALGPEPERHQIPRESGMLTPAVEFTGLDHERLTIYAVLLGVLVSGAVALGFGPQLPGPSPSPSPSPSHAQRPRWQWPAAIVLVLVCAWLRLDMGIERLFDTDESWAYALGGSIFGENHDPWVHPPLFHLVQQPWIRAIGWQPGDELLLLRAPSVGLGLLATALVLAFVAARVHSPWVALVALPCALAPSLASTLVLARPYSLATALLVICAIALWPVSVGEHEPRWSARARWWLILLAAGLAMWTDVIAGAAALALVLARVLSTGRGQHRRQWLANIAVFVVLALWVLPLVPGSLEAAKHHVDPQVSQATLDALGISRPGDVRPDPDLTGRLPAFCVLGLDRPLWPLGLVGLALAAGLALVGWRRREHRIEAALPLISIVLLILIATELVHLRSRNVAFAPHVVAIMAALVLAGRRRAPPEP